MTVAYDFYYDVDSNGVLGSPGFPTSLTISAIGIDDQGGLEPGVTTTLSIEMRESFLRYDVQVEVEIVGSGSDGSLLVEAGDLSGSVRAEIVGLLPQIGDTLYLTDNPDLNGSNLGDLGAFDVEDPSIPPGQEFTYSEGRAEGFVVGNVTANDNEAVTGFAIVSGNQDGFFAINADGEISLTAAGAAEAAASNDFETQPNLFDLEIEVSDAAGNRSSEYVAVSVSDIDDEAPLVIPDQVFNYSEGQAEGFVVGGVMASDNEAVTGFAVVGGNQDGFFAINADGEISLTAAGAAAAAASNDFETQPNLFDLEIEVSDAAGNKSSEYVAVSVSDIDDEAPVVIPDQVFDYSEGQAEGFVVGGVTANDNEAVTGFAIVGGNQDGFFAINADGEISLTAAGAAAAAASNDFETGPNSFSLAVEATDAAGNTGTGVVNVSVTDVAEMPQILGTNRADFLFGSRDGDTIDGRGGSDFIFGGKGDDVILGGRGRDFLTGGTGDDQITGGIGRDVIIGGRGDDLFVLTEGRGRDLILDFEQGQDTFGLQDGLTFDDLSFAGNRILLGADLLAVTHGFQTSQLTADDFLLM